MKNLISNTQNNMSLWEDPQKLEEIKKLFAPKLTNLEFQFFVGIGKSASLNPFLREIWSVKYQESQPAQVFIGRDGYRKAAQAHSEYDFHQADAVYENDEYEVINGEVHHKYKLNNRGLLVGAYCVAKRHKSSRPMYVFCELSEYSTGRSLWNSQTGKPATMIKKVAESQCLRACFQDLLGGTYAEEEEWEEKGEKKASLPRSDFQQNNQLKDLFTPTIIDEPFEHPRANDEQLKEIQGLFTELALTDDRITKALVAHEVSCLEELTETKAKILIYQLNKLKE
jgi:phage recombination protein Bet